MPASVPESPPVHSPHNQNSTKGPPGLNSSISQNVRPVSGRTLFLANCASCHGSDGSGQGEMVLDRPARSFKDGGFSFGNTISSIERVISSGIPGTPMPGFKATLDPRQRLAVAKYVQSLGPPLVVVDPDDTELIVTDRPKVIRGELAPVAEGQPSHVRGLIAGGTDGLSWEYRTDDVRLLAVRQGDFVKRANWSGRSGEPIKPLGRMVRAVRGGAAGPSFYVNGKPVKSQLAGTSVVKGSMAIRQKLSVGDIHVQEVGQAATVGAMSGYERVYAIENPQMDRLSINLNLDGSAESLGTGVNGVHWFRSTGPGGLVEITGLRQATLDQLNDTVLATVPDSKAATVTITTLLVPEWNAELQETLLGKDRSA
ncbi:MAG: c-type cytochrome [Phycisphaerales bacterium]|nr:c-type cytochrome [Phycisphaerales bacterium]